MNRTGQLLCVWSGPVFVVLFTLGFVLLAGFIPPPSPTDGAEEIAAIFREDTDRIRIGMLVSIFAATLLAPWGVAIATQTRRAESGFPALSYTQLVCVAMGVVTGVIDLSVWAVASFRPEDVSAETIRVLNDFGWFLFLFAIPPFCVWLVAVGAAILLDKNGRPVFPRWAGYLSLWAAFILVPAGLIVFFKTGAFAFNGLLALYVPLAIFFAWMIAMTVLVIRAIDRQASEAQPVSREAETPAAVLPLAPD